MKIKLLMLTSFIGLQSAFSQIKLKIEPSMILDEKAYIKSSPNYMFDEQALTGNTEPPVGKPVVRWGEYLDASLYYPISAVIDLGQSINVSNIYLFDGSGTGKVEFFSGTAGNWTSLFVDNLNGYESWNKHTVNKATRYLRVVNYSSGSNFTEVVIFGDKQTIPPVKPALPANVYPIMDDFLGVNLLHVNAVEDAMVVKHTREFHDWNWDEADQSILGYPGYPLNQYAFAPSWAGNWNFDNVYKSFKDNGLTIYPALQGTPYWLIGAVNNDSTNNKPISSLEDAENPASYIEHADYMYQFAARYGSKTVNTGLLKLRSTNQARSGLDYLEGIENWNEPNKNWKGRRGLFTPYEYAAMSSADYDGHEKRLGTTVGMKNADPDIQFIMAGLIALDTGYVKSMKYWFENNRTDKKFVPDVINFHTYSNDGSGQGSQATKGVSPETFGLEAKTRSLVDYCKRNLPGKKVWITEFGYDIQQSESSQKAPPYGSYTAEQVQAMWNIRTFLAFAAAGVDRAYLYWLTDSNSDAPAKFESAGLIKNNSSGKSRRPSWFWLYTMRNILKNFKYASKPASGNANVMIHQYNHATSPDSLVYVLWCPTSNSTTVNAYNLTLPTNVSSASSVTPTNGSIRGTRAALTVNNNTVTVRVTEDPIYVVVKRNSTTSVADQTTNDDLLIYPNPAQDEVNISYTAEIGSIEVMDVKGIEMLRKDQVNAMETKLNVATLAPGIYTVRVTESDTKKVSNFKLCITK